MEIPENILNKLKKLLNKANSAKDIGSSSEAELFAAKAQQIMAEYNLELSQIKLEEDKPRVGKNYLDPKELNKKNQGKWLFKLYKVICDFNYCNAIFTFKQDSLILIGESHNVEMVKYIVTQLSERVKPILKNEWAKHKKLPQEEQEKKGQFIRGYLIGFVHGIHSKLSTERVILHKKKPQIGTMALILTNKVEKFMEEEIETESVKNKGSHSKSEVGYSLGYSKGLNTSIDKGLTNSPLNHKQLK